MVGYSPETLYLCVVPFIRLDWFHHCLGTLNYSTTMQVSLLNFMPMAQWSFVIFPQVVIKSQKHWFGFIDRKMLVVPGKGWERWYTCVIFLRNLVLYNITRSLNKASGCLAKLPKEVSNKEESANEEMWNLNSLVPLMSIWILDEL